MADDGMLTFRVRVDGKRRPTLPVELLRCANLEGARELVAHVEGSGRIVLEDPDASLAAFQALVEDGMARTGFCGDISQDLLDDRRSDRSLT